MPPTEKARNLLIVDDHPIIVVAVKSLIETKLQGYEPHSANTREEALELARVLEPDLAVVDVMLPDGDGLELIRQIKEISPNCRVLVFSMQCELRYGPRAFRAGANGYLMKGDKVSTVVEALEKIEAGGVYSSPALADEMMRSWGKEPTEGIDKVTDRELEVFRLIGEGHSTKEISGILKISSKTVDSHRENLKNKLGCANGTELLLQARDWLSSSKRNDRN
ncbi:response regulator [Luteolibacter marinus]|uniref:response regulator n=1 Tax=Luteolibacter marinus TaxID=2776705 RepID=UPI0018672192|nr:response regulator transcription factor [Luteolibacter marinus]